MPAVPICVAYTLLKLTEAEPMSVELEMLGHIELLAYIGPVT